MKKKLFGFSLCIAVLGVFSAKAGTNAFIQWNFNFPLSATTNLSDDSVLTGTNVPCIGSGTLSLIGGVQFAVSGYDTGSPNCPPCDPFYLFTLNNPKIGPNTNNSAIMVTNYPAVGAANRTGGFEFSFSTVGYTNISVSWDQREGQRASRYHRLQYSADGVNFIDVPAAQGGVITITTQNIFFPQTNNLSAVTNAIENNPNVKLRLVAEFESTAISGGTQGSNYVAAVAGTSAQYLTTAEVRLDMFTVWGDVYSSPNTFPTITVDATNFVTVAATPITNTFTIGDAETPVDSLIVSAASGNTNLVLDGGIEFLDTTGAIRRVRVTPSPTCTFPGGIANIALKVTDGGGQFSSVIFAVDVQSGSPNVQNTPDIGTLQNTPTNSTFTVTDLNTLAENLMVNFTGSSITNVLTSAGISPSGTTSNRNLVLTPQPGALGGTIASIGVTDGNCPDTNSFLFMVVPRSDVIFYDSFNYYADGPLTTVVGGGVWLNNADTPGGVQVVSNAVRLSTTNAEEFIKAPLLGAGTYLASNSVPLYAAMKVTLLALPVPPTPANNTHIGSFLGKGSPGAMRGRVFASNVGASSGFYRLGISGQANTPSIHFPLDLSTNVTYTVVTSFDQNTGLARLWVNPTNELDTFVESTEAQTADSIEYYALRQRPTSSDAIIDDLVVATSFDGALVLPITAAPSLQAVLTNGVVKISWLVVGSTGFVLQANGDLNTTNWQNVAQSPTVEGDRNVVNVTNATGNNFYRLRK